MIYILSTWTLLGAHHPGLVDLHPCEVRHGGAGVGVILPAPVVTLPLLATQTVALPHILR